MIPKKHKFPLRTEFLRFRALSKKVVTPHALLYLAPNSQTRLAVTVPKKTSKLATVRNWLKRLTYDTLYLQVKDKSFDCVVIYKPLPLKKSPALKSELIYELTQSIRNL